MFPGEVFREITIPYPLKYKYAISNRGRIISFSKTIEEGNLLKGSSMHGYLLLRFKTITDGRVHDKQYFVYKLVAQLFLPEPTEDQKYVLHLDHDQTNDKVQNLKWATYEEKLAHYKTSPKVIEGRKRMLEVKRKSDGRKLTITNVIRLKKLLSDPNRKTRLKILAKQFGISEMQLHRIKRGENWAHVVV